MMATKFLTPDELVEYVRTVANQPKLWKHLVEHGESRAYQLLTDTSLLNCWVISWNTGHDTGLHDHDGSSGGVIVVEGIVRESRLYEDIMLGGYIEEGVQYEKGETFQFEPSAIHRVKHLGKQPAVTIHAYSPPLKRMGSYGVDGTEFIRQSMNENEELKPLERAVRNVNKNN